MLKGGKSFMEMPCKDINRSVPYFEEHDETKNTTMNEHVYNFFESISSTSIDFTDKSQIVPGLEKVPDGMLTIKESNKKNLNYKLQINDYSYYQYHRNNGVTKMGFSSSLSSDNP